MRRSCLKRRTAKEKDRILSDLDGHAKALDVLKLFFAVCVAAIHTHALDGLPQSLAFWITQGIFRLAVPFFFVTSGFLLGKKLYGQEREISSVIRGYVLRLLRPMLLAEGANAVLELLIQRLQYGRNLRYLADHFVRHILFYPYGAMWFVQACIVGAGLLYPFLKKGKINAALLTGFLLYGWGLLCNNYYFLAQAAGLDRAADSYMKLFLSARNGIFVGFFFLALGIKTWERYSAGTGLAGRRGILFFAVVLYAAEIYATRSCEYLDDRALYLTHILLIPALLLCAVDIRFPISGSGAVRMRKASVWLYFSHRFFYGLGGLLCILNFGKQWRGPGALAAVLAMSAVSFIAVEGLRRGSARLPLSRR